MSPCLHLDVSQQTVYLQQEQRNSTISIVNRLISLKMTDPRPYHIIRSVQPTVIHKYTPTNPSQLRHPPGLPSLPGTSAKPINNSLPNLTFILDICIWNRSLPILAASSICHIAISPVSHLLLLAIWPPIDPGINR